MSEDLARIACKTLAEAIFIMHDNDWAHRDIKLENTVVDKLGRIRLADFGFTAKGNVSTNVGTQS